jgi:hypothetical protein
VLHELETYYYGLALGGDIERLDHNRAHRALSLARIGDVQDRMFFAAPEAVRSMSETALRADLPAPKRNPPQAPGASLGFHDPPKLPCKPSANITRDIIAIGNLVTTPSSHLSFQGRRSLYQALIDSGAGATSRSGSWPGVLRSMPIRSCSSSTARMRLSTGIVGMCSPLSSFDM